MWDKCYELKDGVATGRWQYVNESGEEDRFFPGWWLEGYQMCPYPETVQQGFDRLVRSPDSAGES